MKSLDDCLNCTQGHFCEEAYELPKDCAEGTYMPYGTDTSTGLYVGPGEPAKREFACIDCPAGYFCGVAEITPQSCGTGKYSKKGQKECVVCEIG